MKRQNMLILIACVVIAAAPLFLIKTPPGDGENAPEIFAGADDKATGVISEISPDYKPWFAPLWEPPSSEVASLLFGLQAAIGAALVGYCVGYYRGRALKIKH